MRTIIALTGVIRVLVSCANAQKPTPDDETAIRKIALDYIEGWYEGAAARMESARYEPLC